MSEQLELNDLEQVAGGYDSSDAQVYKVAPGDTLAKIGNKFGMTAQYLYNANYAVIKAEANRRGVSYKTDKEYMEHIFEGMLLTIPNDW